jgi:hypothetical protein
MSQVDPRSDELPFQLSKPKLVRQQGYYKIRYVTKTVDVNQNAVSTVKIEYPQYYNLTNE